MFAIDCDKCAHHGNERLGLPNNESSTEFALIGENAVVVTVECSFHGEELADEEEVIHMHGVHGWVGKRT